MKRIPFKWAFNFPGVASRAHFGEFYEAGAPSGERLYAFAVSDGNRPAVFDYDIDDLDALAALVRSERVLAVIRGTRAAVRHSSVVSVDVGGEHLEDQMIIPRDY